MSFQITKIIVYRDASFMKKCERFAIRINESTDSISNYRDSMKKRYEASRIELNYTEMI